MHVIAWKTLVAFISNHPDAATALAHWHEQTERNRWDTPNEVRVTFPNASFVGKWTIFNIGGNKYRLVCHLHHNRKRCYIHAILTHREYDAIDWLNEE